MKASSVVLGILAGAAVGAILGVLFAPDSGENTRKEISKKSRKYAEEVKDKFNEIVSDVMQHAENVKEDAAAMADRAKAKVTEAAKKATHMSS